jgi:hypothetical protein
MKPRILLSAIAGAAFASAALIPSAPAQSAPAASQATPLAEPAADPQHSAVLNMRPDCTLGPQGGACEEHAAIFATPPKPNGYGIKSVTSFHLDTYGPSISFGNAGGWTVSNVIAAPHIIFGTSGINQYQSATIYKNAVGDLGGIYYYVYGGGRSAQSDEGVTGMTVESGEINGYFHGTITGSAGEGATSLTLAPTPNAPNPWNYTCAGCMLLDISKGSIAGSLNGKSQPFASTYLYQLPTTGVTIAGSPGSLPLTHAWCTTLSAVPPTETAGVGTSRTVNCTLGSIRGSTPAFTAGGVVTIAGQWYPEQATLVSAGVPSGGVQSLTLLARNPNPVGFLIFQGGIAGQSLSFDANLAASGFRSSYYVFGSVDGVNLIYGSEIAGTLAHHQLPRIGSEAEQINSGFHLYPSAEVVSNSASPSAPTLEPNTVNWQSGDTVENPRYQSYGGFGIRDFCRQFTPTDQDGATGCLLLQLAGPAISGNYHPFRIANLNQLALYRAGGGTLDAVPAISVAGPFGDLMQFRSGPSPSGNGFNAIFSVLDTAASDTTPFNLFSLPAGRQAGGTRVTYDPATKLVGFPQGLATATLATTANCASAASPASCGAASSGSVVIAAGATSVTIMTSAVTANSQILITPDPSLSARLGVSCNTAPASAFALFGISARTPGRSFTLAVASPAAAGANCYSYTIVN